MVSFLYLSEELVGSNKCNAVPAIRPATTYKPEAHCVCFGLQLTLRLHTDALFEEFEPFLFTGGDTFEHALWCKHQWQPGIHPHDRVAVAGETTERIGLQAFAEQNFFANQVHGVPACLDVRRRPFAFHQPAVELREFATIELPNAERKSGVVAGVLVAPVISFHVRITLLAQGNVKNYKRDLITVFLNGSLDVRVKFPTVRAGVVDHLNQHVLRIRIP